MDDLISRKALIDSIKETFCTDCNNYHEVRCRACEWDDAMGIIEDAPAVNPLPCKIGDTVWASGKQNGKPYIRQGVVSEMMYLEDMRLGIVVKFSPRYSHRGFWGKSIFATREECEAALPEPPKEG